MLSKLVPRRHTARAGLMLAVFVLLAAAHTWPLVSAPATLSRNDNGDNVLNEWILAWVVHQAITDPANLFDANIFYPEKNALAFSELMLPQAVVAAPVLWLGGSPVLALNIVLLAGFALTGWAMCFVVQRWTGSWTAGLVAGSLTAFNAHTLTRLAHIQAQHLEFLPFVLLALDRLLASGRVRHGIQLALAFVLQSLTSGYLMVFTAMSILAGLAARPDEAFGPRRWPVWQALTVSAVVVLVLLGPFLIPYWEVSSSQGLTRDLSEVRKFSAIATDYLATGSRLHYDLWSRRFVRADMLFPGVTALLLAAVAIGSGAAWRDRRARLALGFGLVSFCLSFGPAFPLYEPLFHAVPVMTGIRGAARFGQFALAGVAILAAFGLAALRARAGRKAALILGASAVLLVNAEAFRAPLGYQVFAGIPAICGQLPKEPGAVFVHMPLYTRMYVSANTEYMLCSTEHWRPILNGYSGHIPPLYHQHLESLRGFPDDASIRHLRAMKVTHVILHTDQLPAEWVQSVRASSDLRLSMTDGTRLVFELPKR